MADRLEDRWYGLNAFDRRNIVAEFLTQPGVTINTFSCNKPCGGVLNPRWLQVGLMSVNRAASDTMHTPPRQIEYFPSLTRCLRRDYVRRRES